MFFFFFKQKTAYEMRISDWSSDVCSSDLQGAAPSTVRQQRQSEGTDMEISEFHIIGRIGKAAIMDKVAFLDIASNYRRKVDDEWVDDTHWNRVTFFGKLIARLAQMSVSELVPDTGRFLQSRSELNRQVVHRPDVIAPARGDVPQRRPPAGDQA